MPPNMQGQFIGTELDLSVTPTSNAATPGYVLIDPNPALSSSNTLAPFASTAPFGLSPSQMRHAYGIDQIHYGSVTGDGKGQTIAIIDAYDDPTAASDLHAFDQEFGLPDPPSFTKVNQNGGSTLPGTDPAGKGDDWELEESLDIEWAHAIAPAANIILVEANGPDDADLFNGAVAWARSAPGVTAVSMSFGEPEDASQASLNLLFTTPAGHGGVTFLASTGDNGSPGGFPAYSPNVVAVGGTTLRTDSSGNILSETGWSEGGGGISAYQSQPAYQNGVVTLTSMNRAIPDVAFDADPGTGVPVYDSYDYGASTPWQLVGGTSLSAPCWAGLIAIADQGRALAGASSLDGATQTLPRLYSMPASDFHDITSGNNGFPAGPGFDLVTGRGSPVASTLVPFLASAGPYVTEFAPSGLQQAAPSSFDFSFSTAMDPSSFSIATGVDSFVGPDGANLLSSITGYTWLNGNTTVQINFNAPVQQGPYTMTIGPEMSSVSGIAMDQNQNGVAGEITADEYSGTFYYDVTPTQVSSTNPTSGATVSPPFTQIELHFSAPYDPTTIGTGNLTLSQGSVIVATMIDATTARYTLSGISHGGTVAVSMGQGAVRDANGNPVLGFAGSFFVPAPAAPGTPTLLAATDSGISDSDDITNFDNSTPAKAMQFAVPGTVPGDVVSIYSDGILIGSATASSTTTTVITDGTTALDAGVDSITATQSFNGVQSADSSSLSVTILNESLALPTPGAYDPTFNGRGLNVATQFIGYGADDTVIQPDGKVLVAGSMTPVVGGATVATVARYDSDGQLDSNFGNDGYVTIPTNDGDQAARSIAMQSDGSIVVLITPAISMGIAPLELARFNSNGLLDASFGNGGVTTLSPGGNIAASKLLVQPDGKLLVVGTYWNNLNQSFGELIRLNSDGSFDSSFNGVGYLISNFGGDVNFTSVVLDSDGHIIVAGEISPGSYFSVLLARYTTTGTLDTSFGNNGYIITSISSNFSNSAGIALQPDGKVVVSAVLNTGLGLLRYDPNGALDASFGTGGIVKLPSGLWISAPLVQPDGRIVVAGQYHANQSFLDRFNADGSFDVSFGQAGQVLTAIGPGNDQSLFEAAALDRDGRIIVAGVSSLDASNPDQSVWTVARFFGGNAASLALDPSSDSGISNSDRVTNVTTPTFDVPSLSGLYVRIYDNGVLVSSPFETGGQVKLGLQPPGINNYTMTVVDAAGNESPPTAPISVTIDTTPPTVSVSITTALSTSLSSYLFSVTYTDDDAVAYSTLGNGNILVTDPDGYSQLATLISVNPAKDADSVTATYQISPGAGGWGPPGAVYSFTLEGGSVTDVAGNAAASTILGTVAVTSLNPPGQPLLQPATDSGISSSDGITNFDNSSIAKALQFLVPGTLAGAVVTVYADGIEIGSATASGDSTLVATNGTVPLSDGTHLITARQTLGLETIDSPALTITVDTLGPVTALSGPLAAVGPNYDFNLTYSDATGVNLATLGSGNLLVTSALGYSQLAKLVSVSQTNGSPIIVTYQIAPPAAGWGSGGTVYTASMQPSQVGDIAGNFSTAGAIGALLLVPAATPATPILAAATDSGLSSSDDITNFNNNSPETALQFIVNSTTPGDTVTIYANGIAIGSAVATSATTAITTNGTFTLSDGAHGITAQQTAPGQLPSAASPALGVTIETAALMPSAPTLASSSDSGFSNTDGITNVPGPTVNVVAGEVGTVSVQVSGSENEIVSAQVSGPGTVAIPLVTRPGFQTLPALSTGQASTEIATADFNGDGKQDIAILGSSVQILYGNGNGTFQPPVTVPNTSGAYDLLVADFNGDGKPDLWLRVSGGFEVLLNNGNGTFGTPIKILTSIGYHPQAADINGDGRIDIVAQNTANNDTFSVWLGNGDGTFQSPYTVNAGLPVANLIVADLNGDGRPDVVAVSSGVTASMSAILNNGNSTFAAPVLTPLSVFGPNWLASADFNGDGKADIMVGYAASTEQVFVSNGDGTFKAPSSITTAVNSSFVAAGMDFNGDGKADAVVGVGNLLYVCYGNGDGTFQLPVPYTLSSNPYNMAIGDFNGDGAPDIATVHQLTSNNVSILLSNGGALRGGTYTLSASETDLAGNVSAPSVFTTITIDHTPPTASQLVGPALTTPANAPHTFTVIYSDNVAVYAESLDDNNILVTGPNGYSQLGSFVSATPASNGSPIVATYQIQPSAGGWTSGANGTYTVTLEPSQVSDIAGNYAAAGVIGSFAISITAPTAQPQLLAASDSGVSHTDGVTFFNNASPSKALQFSIANTSPGATIVVYADGIPIGSAVATGDTTILVSSGAFALADGVHSITIRQTSPGSAQSLDSPALQISVDTSPPTVHLSPVLSGPLATQSVTITFSEPVYGLTLLNLQLTQNGNPIAWTGAQTLTSGDQVTWVLGNLASLTATAGDYQLILNPTAGITDLAGNALVAGVNTSWVCDALPSYIAASTGATYTFDPSSYALNLTGGVLTFTADNLIVPLINLSASGPGSRIIFQTSEHLAGLSLADGAQAVVQSLGSARSHGNHNVLVIGTLGAEQDPTFSVDASSRLDLEDNDLIVHTGTSDAGGATAYASVAALAAEGRNPATEAPGIPDGQWNGDGLSSSAANAADTAAGYERIGLAVVANGSLLTGACSSWQVGSFDETLGANDIIIKYDYLGDYALEGEVSADDAGILQLEYDNGSNNAHTWATGSSLHDGLSDSREAELMQLQYDLGTGGNNGGQL